MAFQRTRDNDRGNDRGNDRDRDGQDNREPERSREPERGRSDRKMEFKTLTNLFMSTKGNTYGCFFDKDFLIPAGLFGKTKKGDLIPKQDIEIRAGDYLSIMESKFDKDRLDLSVGMK